MKKLIISMVLCLTLITISYADIKDLMTVEFNPWNGVWKKENVEMMQVSEKDQFIDVSGKDAASIYECTGIIKNDKVECVGSGFNFEENLRFVYRSKMKLQLKKNSEEVYIGTDIVESWEATFADGRIIKGETKFKKQVKKTVAKEQENKSSKDLKTESN